MGATDGPSPEALAAALSEVKVCDICGAAGFGEFLTVCTQCNERVEHIYCMQALSDSVPANWVCEGCQKREHDETHEERKLSPRIDLKNKYTKTPLSCQGIELQKECCVSGQDEEKVRKQSSSVQGKEREEARGGSPAKILPSETLFMSVSTENVLQPSVGDVKAGCEVASAQDRSDLERSHCGLKALVLGKVLSCASQGLSSSNLADRNRQPSYLLPSRPKKLHRSNSRYSNVVANKKVGLPLPSVQVTGVLPDEHVANEESLLASGGLRVETSRQQSGMAMKANRKNGCLNPSEVANQSKEFFGNDKDISYLPGRKEVVVLKAHSPGKLGSSGEKEDVVLKAHNLGKLGSSKCSMAESKEPLEIVPAGNLERLSNVSRKGILEKPAVQRRGVLAMQLNVPAGSPRFHAPRASVKQVDFLAVSTERQVKAQGFNPLSMRPCRPYRQDFNIALQGKDHAYGLNVNNNYCLFPQLQAIPYVQRVWRGCFDVWTSANCSVVYDGIQAHFSNKADPKVCEAAQSLPRLLKMKELKRRLDNDTWPQHFLDSPPTSDSIGMFFFPVDMESYDHFYKPLADRLLNYDLVLRAESASLYLLVFHSQLLPSVEQLWGGRHYLWGVFRTKKSNSFQRATVVQSAVDTNKSASLTSHDDVVDMDIDMVGGTDVQPSMSPDRQPSFPPLPPGSPPAKPSPPPTPDHCDEDMDVNLCSRGSPSAPPSPPPTPPQSQQENIFDSSCNISNIPTRTLAAQQRVCSTTNTLESLPDGEYERPQPPFDLGNCILSSKNSHLEDRPEQPSLDGVVSIDGESTLWFVQTSEGQDLEDDVQARTHPIL